MKKLFTAASVLSLSILMPLLAKASGNDTFYVSGNHIYDPCGNLFVPRGINYSVLDDWNFPGNLTSGGEMSTQIAQTNANVVRIAWWINYNGGGSGRPSYALSDLDSIITRFANDGMVSIVTIVDETGDDDTTQLKNNIIAWWTSTDVAALVNKHKKTMIVNIANEWGSSSDLNSYEAVYIEAIHDLRNAGIHVPLLIDGADYANNIPAIETTGPIFESADPLQSVIMAEHAYWAITSTCANNDTATIRSKLVTLNSSAFPVIIGETANWSPTCDGSEQIGYPININQILTDCQQYNMGWLDWEWADDDSVVRQVSADGTFANLTPIGDTIVNNSVYGLTTRSVKTSYMQDGQICGSAVPEGNTAAIIPIQVLTQNYSHQILQINEDGNVRITDMYGKTVWQSVVTKDTKINLYQLNLPDGIYTISHYDPQDGYYTVKTTL